MSILVSCLKSFAISMDDFKRKKKLCIYTTPALQFSTSCHVCNALPGSPAHKTCCLCLTARSPVTGSRLFYFLNLCLPEPLLAVPSILPFIHSFMGKLVVTVQWRVDLYQVTMAERRRWSRVSPRVYGRGLGVWKASWSGRTHSRELQDVQVVAR